MKIAQLDLVIDTGITVNTCITEVVQEAALPPTMNLHPWFLAHQPKLFVLLLLPTLEGGLK